MFNNLSIRSLSFVITLFCGTLIILLFVFLDQWEEFGFYRYFLGFTGCLLLLYFIISTLLERIIFKKLRIIYKFIDKSKKSLNGKDIQEVEITSIDEVNSDVMEWASNTEKRIKSLKTLADYRKDFVGNVSHELKTPIFSLQGYLHTLLDGGIYDESINTKYLRKAAQNADRLQHIVEDLEEIGKIESGNIDLEIEKFDIHELIKEVILEQKRQAEKLKIKLSMGTDGDLPLKVIGDREAIRQVLHNLITNSLKYGEDSGNTVISVFNVNKNILIEVSDDGIGIDSKHLEHLFDRFYRVDKSRSRVKGGSGLGLSIVKHLVEAHDQTITVRSTVGEGSTFGFTLQKV